jgi:hypothetical protein
MAIEITGLFDLFKALSELEDKLTESNNLLQAYGIRRLNCG